jgi:hypothetical protein
MEFSQCGVIERWGSRSVPLLIDIALIVDRHSG